MAPPARRPTRLARGAPDCGRASAARPGASARPAGHFRPAPATPGAELGGARQAYTRRRPPPAPRSNSFVLMTLNRPRGAGRAAAAGGGQAAAGRGRTRLRPPRAHSLGGRWRAGSGLGARPGPRRLQDQQWSPTLAGCQFSCHRAACARGPGRRRAQLDPRRRARGPARGLGIRASARDLSLNRAAARFHLCASRGAQVSRALTRALCAPTVVVSIQQIIE